MSSLSLQTHWASSQPQLSAVLCDPRGFKAALQSLIQFLIAHQIQATLWLKLPKEEAWWTDVWQYGQKSAGCTLYTLGEQIGRPPDDLAANLCPIPIEQDADLKREYLCLAVADNFVGALLAARIVPSSSVPDKRSLKLYCSTSGHTVAALSTGIKAIIEQSLPTFRAVASPLDSVPGALPVSGIDRLEQPLDLASPSNAGEQMAASPNHQRAIAGQDVLSQWDRCFPADLLNQRALPLTDAFLTWQLQFQEEMRSQLVAYRHSAKADLNSASQMMTPDFLSQASQELQSPLTTIKTALTLLGSPALKSAQRQRYLEMIAAQCDRQKSLITSVIGLLQIQATATLPPQTLQLATIIPGIVSTYQPIAEERGIGLACTVPSDLTKILAVESELKQVVIHLVRNGIQMTPPGGHVWVAASPHDSSFVALTVQDSGAGIAKAEAVRLFDAFYRGPTYGDSSLGAGLGLTLVQQLVRRMGGSIAVESTPDRGTTFRVLLPVLQATAASCVNSKTEAQSPALSADHRSAALTGVETRHQ
ncbi:MAG: ATP-binding protein [Phormidesmis sp.]